jgi:hypothetical protein
MASSNSNYVWWNDGIPADGKDLEATGNELSALLSQHFHGRTEKKYENPQSVYQIPQKLHNPMSGALL